jgi:hypothetical protein
VGMVNVGSHAPTCPPFIVALCERGATAIHDKRPRSGRGSDRFPRSGDHFPNTSVLVVLFLVKATCHVHRLGGFATDDPFMLIRI